jgi:hypothetical protein
VVYRRGVVAALAALAALVLSAAPAHAQDYPGTTAPAVCSAGISFSAPALPGATLTVTVRCGLLVDGTALVGILSSTPVSLAPAATVSDHAVSYRVTLPADWETSATHSVTLSDASTGELAASIRFYVGSDGAVWSSKPANESLPRTGAAAAGDLARGAVVLLGAGGAAVRLSQSRRRRTAAAR